MKKRKSTHNKSYWTETIIASADRKLRISFNPRNKASERRAKERIEEYNSKLFEQGFVPGLPRKKEKPKRSRFARHLL